ncbi:hypothetical protein AB0K60_07120 [Thermopolyspora sp. NPDC052614]|uniref:hypothetical protein n=1 Tax=Thermopolyspora sp. NPDC052614 TaxID=3155682 RepID=UPI0034196304
MQTAATPGDEPTPQDIAGLLAEAERIAADHAPPAEPPAPPGPDVQDAPAPLFGPAVPADGYNGFFRERCPGCRRRDGYHDLDCSALDEAATAPPARPVQPGEAGDPEDADVSGDLEDFAGVGEVAPVDAGETRRVRQLRARVAEAHRLVELQDDQALLEVETDKVRKRRLKVNQAARLYALGQDPRALAWRDQKVRRTVTAMVMSAAGIALSVSSIGVQGSVSTALELKERSLAWWAAFGVEPALSLPLLAAVGVQAYSAMRGKVVDRRSPEGKRLTRVEALLLGLTLLLNCWPALPGVAGDFDALTLVVHALGPVAAVTAVWVLPTLWSLLAVLPMPVGDRSPAVSPATSPTGSDLGGRTSEEGAEEPLGGRGGGAPRQESSKGRTPEEHRAELQRLIAAGKLPPRPSARAIQQALHCREELSRLLRDELRCPGGA